MDKLDRFDPDSNSHEKRAKRKKIHPAVTFGKTPFATLKKTAAKPVQAVQRRALIRFHSADYFIQFFFGLTAKDASSAASAVLSPENCAAYLPQKLHAGPRQNPGSYRGSISAQNRNTDAPRGNNDKDWSSALFYVIQRRVRHMQFAGNVPDPQFLPVHRVFYDAFIQKPAHMLVVNPGRQVCPGS